jgi:DNA-binding PadR family transcriptional regulator
MHSAYAFDPAPWANLRRAYHKHDHGRGCGPGFVRMGGRHGGGGPWGFGPGQEMFGGGRGGPWGGGGRGRGRRARRGDVRAALLLLLAEQPANGYQLIQEITSRSDEVWTPSPGSVYPALAQLEDEGLVRATETDGRRAFELTDEGRTHVEENRERFGLPWEAVKGDGDDDRQELRTLLGQVGAAMVQAVASGHTEEAKQVLVDARRQLYTILAEDGAPGSEKE